MENNAQFTMRKVFDSHGDGRVVKIGYMFLHIISMWADEYSFRIVLFTNPNTQFKPLISFKWVNFCERSRRLNKKIQEVQIRMIKHLKVN